MRYCLLSLVIICSNLLAAQDTIATGAGSKNFDHFFKEISFQCNGDSQYISIKFKKSKIKKERKIIGIVNDVMNRSLTMNNADSIFKKMGFTHYYSKFEKGKYEVERIILNTDYIKYVIILAREKATGKTYEGATLKNSFDIYCNSLPQNAIFPNVIDVNFFKKYVMDMITCNYQVFDNLVLGEAYYIWNDLRIGFF